MEVHRILDMARSTIYGVIYRFQTGGLDAFCDYRCENGHTKVDIKFYNRLTTMIAGDPEKYGWNRSTWTRELLTRTMDEQYHVNVSASTIGKALADIGARLGSPRPIVLCPWTKLRKTRRINQIKRLVENTPKDEMVYYQDEVDIHLNPKIGKDWMLPRQQRMNRLYQLLWEGKMLGPFGSLKLHSKGSKMIRMTATGFMLGLVFGLFSFDSWAGQSESSEIPQDYKESELLAMPLEDLLKIKVITASKKSEVIQQAPGIVDVVTSWEIERFGALNLMDLLERVTHIYPVNSYMYRQNTASIRGVLTSHHNKHVLILLNGRPIRESVEGGADFPVFQALPLESVERIEIIRGPGSVLYGSNAYSGVINVILKKGGDSEFQIAGNYGLLNTFNSSVSAKGAVGDLQVFAAIKYLNSDGWRFEAYGEPPLGQPTDPPTQLAGDFGEQHFGSIVVLDYKGFNFSGFYANSEQTIVGPIGIPPLGPYKYHKLFLDIGYTHDLANNWDVSLNATYNMRRSSFPFPTGTEAGKDVDADDFLFEITSRIQPMEPMNIVVGGTVYVQTGINKLLNTPSGQDPYQIPKYTNLWYSGYAQMDYKFIDSIKLVAGAQVNKTPNQSWNITPRAGVVIDLLEGVGAKIHYGEAYRSPYAVETSLDAPGALLGEPHLEAERIRTFDIQFFYNRSNIFHLGLTGFYSRMQKMIAMVPSTNPEYRVTYANKDELDVYGIELECKFSPMPSVYFIGSATYQENKDDSGVLNVTHVPYAMFKAGIFYEPIPAISFAVFNSYYSQPTGLGNVNPGLLEVNPESNSFNWLTANLKFYPTRVWKMNGIDMEVNIFARNLLDQQVYTPEIYRKIINTVPGRGGIYVGGGVRVKL